MNLRQSKPMSDVRMSPSIAVGQRKNDGGQGPRKKLHPNSIRCGPLFFHLHSSFLSLIESPKYCSGLRCSSKWRMGVMTFGFSRQWITHCPSSSKTLAKQVSFKSCPLAHTPAATLICAFFAPLNQSDPYFCYDRTKPATLSTNLLKGQCIRHRQPFLWFYIVTFLHKLKIRNHV